MTLKSKVSLTYNYGEISTQTKIVKDIDICLLTYQNSGMFQNSGALQIGIVVTTLNFFLMNDYGNVDAKSQIFSISSIYESKM